MTMRVFCTTSFEAFHSWDDAPDEVAFLRKRHRHQFHVRLEVGVDHDDRDIEFILLKRQLEEFIENHLADADLSCEQYGKLIRDHFSLRYDTEDIRVEVSEDGENGAIVTGDDA